MRKNWDLCGLWSQRTCSFCREANLTIISSTVQPRTTVYLQIDACNQEAGWGLLQEQADVEHWVIKCRSLTLTESEKNCMVSILDRSFRFDWPSSQISFRRLQIDRQDRLPCVKISSQFCGRTKKSGTMASSIYGIWFWSNEPSFPQTSTNQCLILTFCY